MYTLRKYINILMKKVRIPIAARRLILKLGMHGSKPLNGDDCLLSLKKVSPFPDGTSIRSTDIMKREKIYDLAVIVPVYNNANLLIKCIKSLLDQQTNYSYQIIVVDDGSTDNTETILKYLKKFDLHKKLKIIKQENRGFSGARNRGINESCAKYISFVDSDDFVSTGNFINTMLMAAYNTNADIVECSYLSFSEDASYKVPHIETSGLFDNPFKVLYGYPWGKLYKSSLFGDTEFPEGFWYEDTMGMYRLWPKAKTIKLISPVLYYYRINPNGITAASMGKTKSLDSLYVTIQLLRDCRISKVKLDNRLYNFTLKQMATNFIRILPLTKDVLLNAFFVMANVLDEYFPSSFFKTDDVDLTIVESSLRSRDYKKFVAYCLSL
ncbi:glycosyltransferase family 2 protein [Limosilactobacillus sp.]|uniref:glycosyltransferase family 2 protein n=1 Tax=Limosilactobacillus sp. TaxID=2773925 RepID=UPI00345EE00A